MAINITSSRKKHIKVSRRPCTRKGKNRRFVDTCRQHLNNNSIIKINAKIKFHIQMCTWGGNVIVSSRGWIERIRHEIHTEEKPEMKSNVLIPVATYCVNIVPIGPDGSREFKAGISLRCNFHCVIERTIDWNSQLNCVDFSSILTNPNLKSRQKRSLFHITRIGINKSKTLTNSYNISKFDHISWVTT